MICPLLFLLDRGGSVYTIGLGFGLAAATTCSHCLTTLYLNQVADDQGDCVLVTSCLWMWMFFLSCGEKNALVMHSMYNILGCLGFYLRNSYEVLAFAERGSLPSNHPATICAKLYEFVDLTDAESSSSAGMRRFLSYRQVERRLIRFPRGRAQLWSTHLRLLVAYRTWATTPFSPVSDELSEQKQRKSIVFCFPFFCSVDAPGARAQCQTNVTVTGHGLLAVHWYLLVVFDVIKSSA